MRAKRKTVNTENTENTQSATSIRASISFPSEVYETLEIIAKKKKVSLAWVVREATEKYIADKWPLLAGHRTPEPD
jgi:metal-responsive CopG/Arc/MetJ family transcriptional regulator